MKRSFAALLMVVVAAVRAPGSTDAVQGPTASQAPPTAEPVNRGAGNVASSDRRCLERTRDIDGRAGTGR